MRRAGCRPLPVRALAAVLAAALVCACALAAAPHARADAAGSDGAAVASSVLGQTLGGDRGILPVGLDEDSAAYVTIARLASADQALDNTLVSFRGEVVGEAVRSSTPGYRWVLMQSYTGGSTSSIEVLMSEEQVALIENYGAYKTRGTTLRVTGIYRVADPNQTGELDVTAYLVRVLDAGGPVEETVDLRLLWAGLALTALGGVLCVVKAYLKRRSRS